MSKLNDVELFGRLIDVVQDWVEYKGSPMIIRDTDYDYLKTRFKTALGMDEDILDVSENTVTEDVAPEKKKFVGKKVFSLKKPIEWSENHTGYVLAEYAGIEFSIYFSNLSNAIYYDRSLFKDDPNFYEKVQEWLQKITQE